MVVRNVVLVGGTGAGKTTLADALQRELPGLNCIHISKYAVKVPMALLADGHPDLLSLSRLKYVDTVASHHEVPLMEFSRDAMLDYAGRLIRTYGKRIIIDVVTPFMKNKQPNLLDNVAKASNTRYLRDAGFYVVGLRCSFETQIKRRMSENVERSDIESLVQRSNEFFQVDECLQEAHVVYDTNTQRSDSSEIVREIANVIQ